MDKPAPPSHQQASREVKLDHHDSVRHHVHQQVRSEVERLERRIETLRLVKISTYERMIDRKKGFLQNWDLRDGGAR